MKSSTIDVLIWVYIYGGLLVAGWGLSVQRSSNGLGLSLIVGGGLVAAVGFLLIYIRSRMKNPT